jgi:hypothetical protein
MKSLEVREVVLSFQSISGGQENEDVTDEYESMIMDGESKSPEGVHATHHCRRVIFRGISSSF